jgi:hypothetical protein
VVSSRPDQSNKWRSRLSDLQVHDCVGSLVDEFKPLRSVQAIANLGE